MKIKNLVLQIFLFLIIFLFSCKTKKVILSDDVVKIDDKEVLNEQPDKEINVQTEKLDTILQEVNDTIIKKVELKDVYKIALILPYDEDSILNAYSLKKERDLSDFNFSTEAENALSFLQGAMVALELDTIATKIEIFTFDSKNTPRDLTTILKKVEKLEPDLIVGGMNKYETEIIANFAQQIKCYHFSPFSPSSSVTDGNPYYVMLEPSIDKHFDEMIAYLIDSFPNSSFKIFHEDHQNGISYANSLEDKIKKHNDTTNLELINYALVKIASNSEDRKKFDVQDYLDKESTNFIIFPSFNEGFIQSILFQLNSASRKYDIKLFGMPTWIDSETLRLRHFNVLNLHLTQSSFTVNDTSIHYMQFQDKFKEMYKKAPSFSAFLGADLVSLYNDLIKSTILNQLNFKDAILQISFNGMIKNYDFFPIFNEKNEIKRIENKAVFVVRYENYEIIICR